VRGKAEVAAGMGRQFELIDGPRSTCGLVAANEFGSEAVEEFVVRRMHRDQLALQMGGKLRDLKVVFEQGRAEVIAITHALRGQFKVEEAWVGGRHLHRAEAES
jgi:hypothetical protein